MKKNKIHHGFVRVTRGASVGQILVQVPDANSKHGFYLADDDQSWDGGFGIAQEWETIHEKEVPKEDRERLEHLI